MRYTTRTALALVALLLLSLLPSLTARSASAADAQRCFPETRQCISDDFRRYWERNGGLPIFGYPITPARWEVNRETGQAYLTQWFERNRFELHPENPPPYNVLLGRLGDDGLRQHGIDWRMLPGSNNLDPGDCLVFAQTDHVVCDQAPGLGFQTYWLTHGLPDPQLDAYGRSLALFGLPLTEATIEVNPADGRPYLTQWFERARFEWHPEQPDQYKVLLGLLGNEIARPTRLREVIVDDQSPGFAIDGAWREDGARGYNRHMYWGCASGKAGKTQASWNTKLPAAGTYEVYAFIPDYHSNTVNARYLIIYGNGETTVGLAQQPYSNEWVSLGTFTFGVAGAVHLSDATGEPASASCKTQIAFDAIKWVPRRS